MSTVFDPETINKLGENYKNNVKPEHGESSRGGCMKAVYVGLGTLFGEKYGFRGDFHKKFWTETRQEEKQKGLEEGTLNTIDRVFRALEKEGVAFSEQQFKPKAGKWARANRDLLDSLESELIDQIRGLPNGSQVFGVAVSGALHSLLLRLDKTDSGVRIFWMDQFSIGFDAVRPGAFVTKPDVTGHLDEKFRSLGDSTTSIWLLDPSKQV